MIKCDKSHVEVEGKGIIVLSELSLLTEIVIEHMQRSIPRDIVLSVIKTSIDSAIKLSEQTYSEEQKRMNEVIDILKNMNKSEE